jgi:hypothetical protein
MYRLSGVVLLTVMVVYGYILVQHHYRTDQHQKHCADDRQVMQY